MYVQAHPIVQSGPDIALCIARSLKLQLKACIICYNWNLSEVKSRKALPVFQRDSLNLE